MRYQLRRKDKVAVRDTERNGTGMAFEQRQRSNAATHRHPVTYAGLRLGDVDCFSPPKSPGDGFQFRFSGRVDLRGAVADLQDPS